MLVSYDLYNADKKFDLSGHTMYISTYNGDAVFRKVIYQK